MFKCHLAVTDELHIVVLKPDFTFVQRCAIYNSVSVHKLLCIFTHVRGYARIRRIADDDGEAFIPFNFVDGFSFVRKRFKADLRELVHLRFQRVGEVDAGAFVAAKTVAGLGELQAEFQMGDGIGRGQQFVAVQARKQVLGNVFVPELGPPKSDGRCFCHLAVSVR